MLVFIAAERRELEGLLAHLRNVTKPDWPVDFVRLGELNGKRVALVANGPGTKLASIALDVVNERERMDGLISTGFCGGLSPALAPCDIFVATEVIDVGAASLPVSHRPFKTGRLISTDRVVSTAEEKSELAKSGADAVDMEAGAVGQRAKRHPIPFFAVRVVTDTASENFPLDFNQMRDANGRFSRWKIVLASLRRSSTVIPALIKLNRRTKRAAAALGDFLDDARF